MLPWEAFCYPGWEQSAAQILFDPNAEIETFEESYAIHLFESHANLVGHVKALTTNQISRVDNNFNRAIKDLLF